MEKTLDELRQDVDDKRALLDNLDEQQHILQNKAYKARQEYVMALIALKAFEAKGEQNGTII